ncbi:hypothetical protein CSUI_009056, partial [Cystoisospora suis]
FTAEEGRRVRSLLCVHRNTSTVLFRVHRVGRLKRTGLSCTGSRCANRRAAHCRLLREKVRRTWEETRKS